MHRDITLGISGAVAEERRAWEAKKPEEIVLPGGVRFFHKKENPSAYVLPWAVWIESTSLVHYPIHARIKGGLAEDQAKFLANILNKIFGTYP